MDNDEYLAFTQKTQGQDIKDEHSEVSSEVDSQAPRQGNVELCDNQDYNKMI